MYWGLVFLGVSLLALPFALAGPVNAGSSALIVFGIFLALSLTFFVYGRDKRPRGDARRPRTKTERGDHA